MKIDSGLKCWFLIPEKLSSRFGLGLLICSVGTLESRKKDVWCVCRESPGASVFCFLGMLKKVNGFILTLAPESGAACTAAEEVLTLVSAMVGTFGREWELLEKEGCAAGVGKSTEFGEALKKD